MKGSARDLSARKHLSNRKFGEWLSLVEHLVRDQGVGGSNPLSPTIKPSRINNLNAGKRVKRGLLSTRDSVWLRRDISHIGGREVWWLFRLSRISFRLPRISGAL